MTLPLLRRRAIAFPIAALIALSGLNAPSAKAQAAAPTATDTAQTPRPWLYENSDLPADPAWRFGTLPNGLRYAVRQNGVPPGQVSIRVRVDAGSLMERDDERGFAHLIEHLSFRGSRDVPDGESKRIWQRLGATFGSDSNAQTSYTGTSYALDLPTATPAGLDESMKILAGMMAAPNITPTALDAERAVVLAELRENDSPLARVGDETRAFYFSGQLLSARAPIGTIESLRAASAEAINAFHKRWYRPDRTVVVISGDAPTVVLEALIERHFGNWQPSGPKVVEPDFGDPDPKGPSAKFVVAQSAPPTLGIVHLRPWRPRADTYAYNQGRMVDLVALQIIQRRLEVAARAGASYLQATIVQQDVSRSVDGTFISILPAGPNWQKALQDVRAIIEDARRTPPSAADIEREYRTLDTEMAIAVDTADTDASASQADLLLGALEIRETVVSPETQLDVLRRARPQMTPAAVMAATQRLTSGAATRALLTLPMGDAAAQAQLAGLLNTAVVPNRSGRLPDRLVTIDQLPPLPPAGTVVSRTAIGVVGAERITFANGVTLILAANRIEDEKVRINVRFGDGQRAFSPDRDSAAWAANVALMAGGIGDLGVDALDELTNARRIGLDFRVDDDAFEMSAVSRPADYRDQLRLFATKLAFPRWDAAPVTRVKAAALAAYDTSLTTPDAVLSRQLSALLRDGDKRFGAADRTDIAALTPATFRAIWEPVLKSGPIEVLLFGDVKADEAIAAVAATFGALPQRAPAAADALDGREIRVTPPKAAPVVLRHQGLPDQAAAAIAWPTGGGIANVRESRQLDILAEIISDRLFDRLRTADGSAYSPQAASSWPLSFDAGGYVVVASQLRPDRIDYFRSTVDAIVADLANSPVSDDELQRVVQPMRQMLARASTGNAFWMNQMEGISREPQVLDAMRSYAADISSVTASDIQSLARRYLASNREVTILVLPKHMVLPEQKQASAKAR